MPGLSDKSPDLLKQNQGAISSPVLQDAGVALSTPMNGGKSVLNSNLSENERLDNKTMGAQLGKVSNAQELNTLKPFNENSSLTSYKISNNDISNPSYGMF